MSEAKILEVEVSPMRPDELPFVASSWKRSYHDAPQNEQVPPPAYYARMNRLFDALMERPVTILVARDPERPAVIFGYVCFERGAQWALHYIFVRKSHRELGVASALLRRALDGAETEQLVYTAGTRFDTLWERWGFERVQLADWLRGEAA